MQTWEYMAVTLEANIDNEGSREYMSANWPGWEASRYAPQTVNPLLNSFGQAGWELVHMEAVAGVGGNGDIRFTGEFPTYSRFYFCVFKRPTGQPTREG